MGKYLNGSTLQALTDSNISAASPLTVLSVQAVGNGRGKSKGEILWLQSFTSCRSGEAIRWLCLALPSQKSLLFEQGLRPSSHSCLTVMQYQEITA